MHDVRPCPGSALGCAVDASIPNGRLAGRLAFVTAWLVLANADRTWTPITPRPRGSPPVDLPVVAVTGCSHPSRRRDRRAVHAVTRGATAPQGQRRAVAVRSGERPAGRRRAAARAAVLAGGIGGMGTVAAVGAISRRQPAAHRPTPRDHSAEAGAAVAHRRRAHSTP